MWTGFVFNNMCSCVGVSMQYSILCNWQLMKRNCVIVYTCGEHTVDVDVTKKPSLLLPNNITMDPCFGSLSWLRFTELCTPITQSRSSCHLRSSYRNRLAVLSVKLSIGSRSFSVSGPTVWNARPDYLRNPTLSIDVFKCYLKTFLFAHY